MNMHVAPSTAALAERVEVVRSAARLAAVEGEWTRLWREAGAPIFQSHAWIAAWHRTLPDPAQVALRIGLLWQGDRLLAVLPLAVSRRKGLRMLEWAAGAYADYGDVLCLPGCSDAALKGLWAAVCREGGFDLAMIGRLQPDSRARVLFDPASTGPMRLHPHPREEISARIGGAWESGAAWLASHPKKPRQNYRRGIKQMEETGPVRFRLLDPSEPVGPVLDRLMALKRRWLQNKANASALFDEGSTALAALVDVLAQAGILRLFVIEVGDLPVAISVNFVQGDTMMAWVTTYDPDFARASPGTVLIYDYVQWSFDHRLSTIDLLCGGEAFKDRLATHTVALSAVTGARTALGSLALAADGLRRRLRKSQAPEAKEAEPG